MTSSTNPKVEEVMRAVNDMLLWFDADDMDVYDSTVQAVVKLVEALALDADRYHFIRDREQARIYVSAVDSVRSTGESLDSRIDSLLKEQKLGDVRTRDALREDDSIFFSSPDWKTDDGN